MMPTYRPLYVFAFLFVFGVAPPGEVSPKTTDDQAVQKLTVAEEILTTLEYSISRSLEKPYPRQAYGSTFRELVSFEGEYNEKKVDPEIVEELKIILFNFYAITPVNTESIEILANYHVTHIASWFNLSFQTCISYYGDDEQFQTISKSCERLSRFLKMFVSVLSHIKTYQFAQFKKESPKHIKTIERTNMKEEEAKKISKRLQKAIEITEAKYPDIHQCEEKKDENEKNYCQLWITKLIEQPVGFNLDHIFFDVYNGLEKKNFDAYSPDSYTSDYNESKNLWEYTPQLLEKVDEIQKENKETRRMISSFAVTALIQIIRFKMARLGVDISKLDPRKPDIEKPDYATENIQRYLLADETPTDTAD